MSRPPDDKNLPPEGRDRGTEGSAKAADPWSGFEPYAQLCRSLLPRARTISIFDARGVLRWSTDADAAAIIKPVIASALVAAHSVPGSAGDQALVAASVH